MGTYLDWPSWIMILLTLVVICVAIFFVSALKDQSDAMREFCEDQGYEFGPGRSNCHKIKGDTLIKRGIVVIDREVYWKEEG